MPQELNENFKMGVDIDGDGKPDVAISVKTIAGIIMLIVSAVGFWYSVQAQIDGKLDKVDLPPPEISRVEYDLKDKLVRNQIKNIDENVEEIKVQLEKIEERLYEMR
tara:strand:- start:490 stop:810 length:321 start_codon:yes stop_codon:yes gene_type:complete